MLHKSYKPTYKLDLKRVWNKAFFAHQMQNFIKQVDVQSPKIIV